MFFGKRKNNTHKIFHILETKAHSETHFENENIFSEKKKVLILLKKTAIGKEYKERF